MNNLLYFRKKYKLSQQQVADALYISRRAYGSYETGERKLPLAIFIALAKLYGISLDVLAGVVIEQGLFDDARINR